MRQLLLELLREARLRVRYFPSTMALSCCGRSARCYLGHKACVTLPAHVRTGTRTIAAKYFDELKFAVRHAAALGCPGAQYLSAGPRAEADERLVPPSRAASIVIGLPLPRLHLWHPSPSMRHAEGKRRLATWAAQSGLQHAPTGVSAPVYTHWVRLLRTSAEVQQLTANAVMPILAAEEALSSLQLQPPRGAEAMAVRGQRNASRLTDENSRHSVLHCPTLPRYWWPEGAVGGYCAATNNEGDCESGKMGTFKQFIKRGLYGGALQSLGECAKLCARCSRCRYVSMSLSPDVMDCSWYHECDLSKTHKLAAGPDFVSISLRDAQRYNAQCKARYVSSACGDS